MGRSKRFKKRSPQRRDRVSCIERALDAETLRDTVGTTLYDRVMEWNDSGAAEALQVAEQRRKAKEIKKPCWVPKLNNDLYIATVDWNVKESEELCTMPKSAVAFAEESHGEPCSMNVHSLARESEQRMEISSVAVMQESSNLWCNRAVLDASIDTPLMVDAVLEHCADGLRLLVGGRPVEPSGWDEVGSEFPDGPCLVEAVLEDFGSGKRLLVGGWPVQPSWDELDTNWSQLGWDTQRHNCCEHAYPDKAQKWKMACFSGQQPGWQDSSCYLGNVSNSFYQGQQFMAAF